MSSLRAAKKILGRGKPAKPVEPTHLSKEKEEARAGEATEYTKKVQNAKACSLLRRAIYIRMVHGLVFDKFSLVSIHESISDVHKVNTKAVAGSVIRVLLQKKYIRRYNPESKRPVYCRGSRFQDWQILMRSKEA